MNDASIISNQTPSGLEMLIDEYKQLIHIALDTNDEQMIRYYADRIAKLRDKTDTNDTQDA